MISVAINIFQTLAFVSFVLTAMQFPSCLKLAKEHGTEEAIKLDRSMYVKAGLSLIVFYISTFICIVLWLWS